MKSSICRTDQQQPEVASGLQTRTAGLLGVESLAQALDVAVEVVLIENLIQSRVERMRSAPRQILCHYSHRRLLCVQLAFAHRRRRQCRYVRSIVSIPFDQLTALEVRRGV